MTKLRIGVLGSTSGTDLQGIIEAIEQRDLTDVEISVVISNRPDALILERAKKHNLLFKWINPQDFSDRESFDRAVALELEDSGVDLILMIGYMRIVTPWFVEHYLHKMINVHPSLLPAFGGAMDRNVHQMVLESGVKVTGCTIHFVTTKVDSGPIIYQKAIEIAPGETVDSLKEKVQALEQAGFIQVLKWFSHGQVQVEGDLVRII